MRTLRVCPHRYTCVHVRFHFRVFTSPYAPPLLALLAQETSPCAWVNDVIGPFFRLRAFQHSSQVSSLCLYNMPTVSTSSKPCLLVVCSVCYRGGGGMLGDNVGSSAGVDTIYPTFLPSFAWDTPRYGTRCLTPFKIIILGEKMMPQWIFSILTPLTPLPPPCTDCCVWIRI